MGPLKINGLSQLRSIILPKHNLCILVEVQDKGVLGIDENGELFFLSNDGDAPERLLASFCEAIRAHMPKP